MHSPRSFRCNVCTTYHIISFGFLLLLITFYIIFFCVYLNLFCNVQSHRLPMYEFPCNFQFIDVSCKPSTSSDVKLHSYPFILRRTSPQCIRRRVVLQYTGSYSFSPCLNLITLLICSIINEQSSLPAFHTTGVSERAFNGYRRFLAFAYV